VNTLETHTDVTEAVARLARRPPEILAAFIVSLAHRTDPVHERVLSFLAADDPAALSTCLAPWEDLREVGHSELGAGLANLRR